MSDSLLLKPQEIHGIRIDREPEICTSMSDNFFLYCIDNTLYTFDSTNLTNTTLPQYDSAIDSHVITSLAISPSKTTAAAGFGNGSIQVYDLTKNALSKPFIQKEGFPATNITFLDDTTILSVDASYLLRCFPLASIKSFSSLASYMFKALKESFSIQLNKHVRQILTAPILNSKKAPNNFSDIVCITTEDRLYLSKISNSIAEKKEDLVIRQVNCATATFSIQSSTSSLLCAYAAACDISLITLRNNESTVKQLYNNIDEQPLCINFFSENTLIVVFNENSCLITSILDEQGSHTKAPIAGKFVQGYSKLFVFGNLQPNSPTKLYEIKMVTFENKIDTFMENDDLESAINLCRKAMKNDQSSISGLPANELQKARVIERTLSPFLKARTQKILSEGTDQDASAQASFLINLAKELKMTDWIVADAVELYKEVDKLPIFFKLIISDDPDGKMFNYTNQFVESLLQDHGELDITPFILSLSSSIAPPKRLLQYGLETKNSQLLAQVYLKKLNDPLKCVMIYSHSNYNSAFEVLLNYFDTSNIDHSNELLKWVFSSSQNEKLPHMRAIIRAGKTDVIDKMKKYVNNSDQIDFKQKIPLTMDQFINSTIYACTLENVQPTSKVHNLISSYIIGNPVNLTNSSIKYILSRIFTESSNDDEEQKGEKEALLFVILNNNPDNQMLESLLPLCASFNFKNVRKRILTSLKKFDVLIMDQIIDEGNGEANQDTFSFIQKLIRNEETNKDKESLINIKKAIFSNSILLISKDVNSFVNIILTSFAIKDDEKEMNRNTPSTSSSSNLLVETDPNPVKRTIQGINEELLPFLKDEPSIKHYYLRALLSDDRGAHTKLGKKETKEYVDFLCHYFPNEVRRFIMNRDDVDVTDYLDICKQYNIIDALAVIYNKISETTTSLQYLHQFLEEKLYAYAVSPLNTNDNENDDTQMLDDALSLLSDIISKGKMENIEEYCTLFIKSFVPPIYKVKDQPEKAQTLCEYLRRVETLAADRISFDKILQIIVVEFSPLDLGVMRNILCGIINDYNYDIDTSKSLALLFQQDEIKIGRAHV